MHYLLTVFLLALKHSPPVSFGRPLVLFLCGSLSNAMSEFVFGGMPRTCPKVYIFLCNIVSLICFARTLSLFLTTVHMIDVQKPAQPFGLETI